MATVRLETHGKAVVVKGDTMQIKDFLKEKGGKWNMGLKCWMWPGSKKESMLLMTRTSSTYAPQHGRQDVILKDLQGSNLIKKVTDETGTSNNAPAAAPAPVKASSSKGESKKRTKAEESGDGEQVFELPDLVRATLSSFQGKLGLDLRRFYEDKASNEVKPTPKGVRFISSEWEKLCSMTSQLDELLKKGEETLLKVDGDIMASAQSGSLDLRRFYVDKNDGESKPTKKGIRISSAQWEALKAKIDDINSAFAGGKVTSASSTGSPSKKAKVTSSSDGTASDPNAAELRAKLQNLLKGRDLAALSLKTLRSELEVALSLPEGGLLARKEEVKGIVTDLIQSKA